MVGRPHPKDLARAHAPVWRRAPITAVLRPIDTVAARTADPAQLVVLADTLYAALRAAGWIPSEAPLLEHTPRFVRPHGFKPRPGEPKQ